MIQLLLIRHGIADDPRPGLPDADRALTAEGWARTRSAMQGLVECGYRPTRGISSPYRRALETMQCLREVTATAFPVTSWQGLTPDAGIIDAELWLRALLAEASPCETLALTSHQPFLGAWIRHLTGRDLDIKKASCTVLRWDDQVFTFATHFSPSLLREKM